MTSGGYPPKKQNRFLNITQGINPHGFLLSFAKLNTIYIGVKLGISKTGLTLPSRKVLLLKTLEVCDIRQLHT